MPDKLTLNDCIRKAQSRNGICLSTEYNNSKMPMLWECVNGHTWKVSFSQLCRRKKYCPKCG